MAIQIPAPWPRPGLPRCAWSIQSIVAADDRRSVVSRIEDFVRRHDDQGNRFMVTSRIAGYRSATLGPPFAQYTVQEMDDAQIRQFLEHWCPAVEEAQTPDLSPQARQTTAQREIDSILEAVTGSPGVRRLASNPLLLRVLALIHRTGARLPQRRIELYKLAADTLARTWRPAQGVPEAVLVEERYLTPLLGKLAYEIHRTRPTGIAIEREVHAILGTEWARIRRVDVEAQHEEIQGEVDKFLAAVREHTGLFVERAPRRYGFMHMTFEEYYAARHLVRLSRKRAQLIRQHLHDPRWEEPILLALCFVSLDYPEEAADLVKTAILAQGDEAEALHFAPSAYEDLLGRDYLFVLRCLGDLIPVHPETAQRLIERLTDEILHQTGSARFERYRQTIAEQLAGVAGSEAAQSLARLLASALADADWIARVRAAQSLGQLGRASPDVVAALIHALADGDWNVRVRAAQSLGQLGQAPRTSPPSSAQQ